MCAKRESRPEDVDAKSVRADSGIVHAHRTLINVIARRIADAWIQNQNRQLSSRRPVPRTSTKSQPDNQVDSVNHRPN